MPSTIEKLCANNIIVVRPCPVNFSRVSLGRFTGKLKTPMKTVSACEGGCERCHSTRDDTARRAPELLTASVRVPGVVEGYRASGRNGGKLIRRVCDRISRTRPAPPRNRATSLRKVSTQVPPVPGIPIRCTVYLEKRVFCKTAKRHSVVGTVKDFRCACKCDGLITLDGVVAMKDPQKPHTFVRIVCPNAPPSNKCERKKSK
ncbi:Hypothetical protein CINCED_3A022365 [Cinara cedri]|uniref:Uncharacterized protein n=1 Tax=Cinara cedri TaxID=506608 RepID=A0A5E4NE46_9HEMI|nr:Hypothetical protein CINCED_3A022365 [Cinara cedri]